MLLFPVVVAVKALLPTAVLFAPVVMASKAVAPRTVLEATEFAPLPTVTLLIVESAETVRPDNVPTDVIFGWMDEADDFPENFYEDDEETEYFFPEKNLTFGGKL